MATSNTLTGLIPVLYQALDTVAQEPVGSIAAVSQDVSGEMAALNQTIRTPVTRSTSLVDITPNIYAPNAGGQTIDYVDIAITKSKAAEVLWNGEEQKSVGGLYQGILMDQFTQAFRQLRNAVDTDIMAELRLNSSRAQGSSGVTPFGTAGDLSDIANLNQILDLNGAPTGDRHLIFDTYTRANLGGKQSVLFKANEAGTSELLRNNVVGRLEGFDLHVSNFVSTAAKGNLSAGTVTASKGDTVLTVAGGTGAILAGDVITFAGDTNKYVVLSATGSAPTTAITIAAPGLINAVSSAAVTVANQYKGNIALYRGAMKLVTRAPAMPVGGDAATDVMMITDPVSGLTFQVAEYAQYRQRKIEIGLAWGVKAIKPSFIATLLG